MKLVGSLRVPLPIEKAFRLFTAEGERDWAEGWEPSFPEPVADDAEVGTVFETGAPGRRTTWMVVDRDGDRRIRYARVVPDRDAGTVEVSLAPGEGGGTTVTVIYQVTALTAAGESWLTAFAAGYPTYLESWAEAIDGHLHRLEA